MAEKFDPSNPIDNHIGNRMQLRRRMLGMSQQDLGELCGVSCQQIQKYESATNRISASRLFQIGLAMDTPVSFFFCGLPGNLPDETRANRSAHRRLSDQDSDDPMAKSETLRLITLYWKLPTDKQRESIMEILSSLAQPSKPLFKDDNEN